MELAFEKYEGLGNDFVVCRVDGEDALSREQAIALCDRHFGLGADGVLLVSPASSPNARARMTVLNADGSRPEMCGNGLRCVALYLTRHDGVNEASFDVETDAGLRHCEVLVDGARGQVTTGLGRGRDEGATSAELGGEGFAFTRISMGNPHAICFREPISTKDLDVLGPLVSGGFPEGSNVEIATVVKPDEIRVDVWERGVGRTLACGTGAAATAVAAVRAGHSPARTPLTVHLPGGPLRITVADDWDVTLEGPARWVFNGTTQVD